MQVAFRTDASLQIGTGHVMRCLALADALKDLGNHCTFVCRPHLGNLMGLISQRGHAVKALELPEADLTPDPGSAHAHWLGTDWASDARQTRQVLSEQELDWLVVDHYALDRRWEHALRPSSKQIMVIDDLADRLHDCNLLVDQNLGRRADHYSGLVPKGAQTLVGPTYALLRPEFAQWREYSLTRRSIPKLKNLLITMGGVDRSNITEQALITLSTCPLPDDMCITVVMGRDAPWLENVSMQAARMPWNTKVLVDVSNMAEIMAKSDLAIGAAGGTAWERCALGLPSVILAIATNQSSGAQALHESKASIVVKDIHEIKEAILPVTSVNTRENILKNMSLAAAAICSGAGAGHVAAFLDELDRQF